MVQLKLFEQLIYWEVILGKKILTVLTYKSIVIFFSHTNFLLSKEMQNIEERQFSFSENVYNIY